MNKTLEITLEYPITHDGKIYRSFTLCRLKGVDMKAALQLAEAGDEGKAEEFLFSRVCQVPVEIFRELDADDYMAVIEAAQDFLPRRFLKKQQAGGEEQSDSSQTDQPDQEALPPPTGQTGESGQDLQQL